MDEFKRTYSNEDTEAKAIPNFWEHFEKENYSIWYCEYKYPDELTLMFMSCNLVSGMMQRLDKWRKNAFGSMCLFGTDRKTTISGLWFWRGHELVFPIAGLADRLRQLLVEEIGRRLGGDQKVGARLFYLGRF